MSRDPIIQHFDSPEAFGDWVIAQWHKQSSINHAKDNDDWAGLPMQQAADVLRDGSIEHLARAEEIISKLDIDDVMSLSKPVLQSSVVGYIPNVPAYIAGRPDSMYNRGWIEEPNAVAPLSVYVETSVSAGVSQKKIINRGIAVLAFVLAMESVRPVDLYTINPMSQSRSGSNSYIPIVRVASRPMDLGRAVFMLTNVAYSRRLSHAAVNAMSGDRSGGYVQWLEHDHLGPDSERYEKTVRDMVKMAPDDVLLKGGHLHDQLMLTNPVQWVQDMINKHRAGTQN